MATSDLNLKAQIRKLWEWDFFATPNNFANGPHFFALIQVVFDGFPFAPQLFTCIFSTKSHLPSGMFPRHSFPLNYDKMYAWLS